MPFVASVIFGIIAVSNAAIPALMYAFGKSTTLGKLNRNGWYKWAWYFLVWGGIIAHAPQAVLWPFSYMGIGAFYAGITQSLATIQLVHRVLTTLLLNFAWGLYLYEPDLERWVVELEFYLYVFIVWVFFLMLRVAY